MSAKISLNGREGLRDLRPGCFSGNAAILLAIVKSAAAEGVKRIEIPRDALRGGDCGALNDHPAFLAELASARRRLERAIAQIKGAPRITWGKPPEWRGIEAGDDPRHPFCGHAAEVFARQTEGLARRLAVMNCRHVVLGLSGGLDSALALLVAVSAFAQLGFDRAGIHVYTMPGFGTTRRTRGNADLLCEGLGVSLEVIDITPACRLHFRDIGHPESLHDVVFENTQARERTQILMDKANQLGGIVLGTGDMSEIALGWSTYNGDHMSMFGVNAGVPKTAVREVCAWWARTAGIQTAAARAILDIVETPVSPELLPAKRGQIAQRTEDHVGPYELHDFFLWRFVAGREGRAEILAAAKRAFRGVYDAATIRRWLDLFFRRFFSQTFKRNCAPDGIPVFRVYLAPHAWWMPSDAACEL